MHCAGVEGVTEVCFKTMRSLFYCEHPIVFIAVFRANDYRLLALRGCRLRAILLKRVIQSRLDWTLGLYRGAVIKTGLRMLEKNGFIESSFVSVAQSASSILCIKNAHFMNCYESETVFC